MGFLDIVLGGGIFEILMWLMLLLLPFIGLILGIISLICSASKRKAYYPLTFKLLIFSMLLIVLLGCTGSIHNLVKVCDVMNMATGAAKAAMLARSISSCLWEASISVLGVLIHLFFITVSVILIHFKKFPETNEGAA